MVLPFVSPRDLSSDATGLFTELGRGPCSPDHRDVSPAFNPLLAASRSVVPSASIGRLPDNAHDETDAPVFWRPVAMIVFAGAALLLVGHRIRALREPDANPPNRSTLLRTLEQIDRPFVSQPNPNNPKRHRITYDRRQRVWCLETDTDGDGQYDRMQNFR